jgi:hypothetical protein
MKYFITLLIFFSLPGFAASITGEFKDVVEGGDFPAWLTVIDENKKEVGFVCDLDEVPAEFAKKKTAHEIDCPTLYKNKKKYLGKKLKVTYYIVKGSVSKNLTPEPPKNVEKIEVVSP